MSQFTSLQGRTLGDGMDSSLLTLTEYVNKNLNLTQSRVSLRPTIPKGKIILTVPKFVPKEVKKTNYLTKKPKEPKFVPCEPFKGAVNPIIPKRKKIKVTTLPVNKNNVDIQDLVHQMVEMRACEFNKLQTKALENKEVISFKQWQEEKAGYETDIKNLRETNAHLENQLKFQAQVNSELKTLLVAAVGEDLETRVQHLTEDKLQLARALLNSANHLTSHQERTEWLSGQCEVWRSKFLASSLMVEELACWKSALSNRIQELQETMKVLIDERTKVRNYSLKTYSLLQQIQETVDHGADFKKIKSANVIDLGISNFKLAENLTNKLVENAEFDEDLLQLHTNTPGENAAIKILKCPVAVPGKRDNVCNALVDVALTMNSGPLYGQLSCHATCCKHCKGDVVNI